MNNRAKDIITITKRNVIIGNIVSYIDESAATDFMTILKKIFRDKDYNDFANLWGLIGTLISFVNGVDNPISSLSSKENATIIIVNLIFNLISIPLRGVIPAILIPKIADSITKIMVLIENGMIIY